MTANSEHSPESTTLYIPLYGKAKVSAQGVILCDEKAEEIWRAEGFELSGKSTSKWLAYYMAMRAKVFDEWVDEQLRLSTDALVLQIGCGLDSRCLRVAERYERWTDCDLASVIEERGRFFADSQTYSMRVLDATCAGDIESLPTAPYAIVELEGLSMYLTSRELERLLVALKERYPHMRLLIDVYTELGARASRHKNPVNDVGVSRVYGIDDMEVFASSAGFRLARELSMTPEHLVNELKVPERIIFRALFAGRIAKSLYRLYELEA